MRIYDAGTTPAYSNWATALAAYIVERVPGANFARNIIQVLAMSSLAVPGLVLGLDRGGSCIGLAFRVPGELREEVVAYLRERELVTNVYLERWVKVALEDGRAVEAVTYVADRGHEQYAGALGEVEAAAIVRGAVGQSGVNEDYVLNTIQHLEALGIRDRWLEEVARLIVSPENASGPLNARR